MIYHRGERRVRRVLGLVSILADFLVVYKV